MQCDRCASEKHEVLKTVRNVTVEGKVSTNCDVRRYRCVTCGLVLYVECRKVYVEVFDTTSKTSKRVTPAEYMQDYFDKDYISPNQLRLFKD